MCIKSHMRKYCLLANYLLAISGNLFPNWIFFDTFKSRSRVKNLKYSNIIISFFGSLKVKAPNVCNNRASWPTTELIFLVAEKRDFCQSGYLVFCRDMRGLMTLLC